jgi:hypothetical protein
MSLCTVLKKYKRTVTSFPRRRIGVKLSKLIVVCKRYETKEQPCVKSKLSYKRQVTQGEAQARQNARSDRVCLDFFFGSFFCIKWLMHNYLKKNNYCLFYRLQMTYKNIKTGTYFFLLIKL